MAAALDTASTGSLQRRCSPRARPPCLAQLLLGLAVCVAIAGSAQRTERTFLGVQEDSAWPWVPQLDLPLPPDYTSGQRVLNTSEHWMLLTHAGVPLQVSADSSGDLMRLVEVLRFAGSGTAAGVCPTSKSASRTLFYAMHPTELEILYGEPRWAALRRLQRPAAWSLVRTEAVGPAVRAAERYIAGLKAVHPPGELTLAHKLAKSTTPTARVPFADFGVTVRTVRFGAALQYSIPQVVVDSEAAAVRVHTQHLLQEKLLYHERLARFDAQVAAAQLELNVSLEELRAARQEAFEKHIHFKRRYQQFLMDRAARQRAAEEEAGHSQRRGAPAGNSSAKNQNRRAWAVRHAQQAALEGVRHTTPAAPGLDSRTVSCSKVAAAWATLQRLGSHLASDPRAAQLRRLHNKHACTAALPGQESPGEDEDASSDAAAAPGTRLSKAAADVWRSGLREMAMQRRVTGRAPTFAQVFAVLFAVYDAEREEGMLVYAQAPTAGTLGDDFDPAAFVTFAAAFLESGEAARRASQPPQWLRAELEYVVGVLHLTSQAPSPTSSNQTTGAESSPSSVVRGVLHLHAAVSLGSRHAAGALATLREHGLFARQHSKAAMSLLLRSMQDAPTHLWRELLLRRRPRRQRRRSGDPPHPADPSTAAGTATALPDEADAARLLRFEQFYAVDHAFSEIDDPFMTKQSVATLVAVTNENVHSSDEEPEEVDVFREAHAQFSGGGRDTPLTGRLKRRVLKSNLLLSGFKGVQRDAREAECELLVVLRRLGYFCDLDIASIYAAEADGRMSEALASPTLRLSSITGVPLPATCREHQTELFTVLSNGRHTLLSCPGPGWARHTRGRRQLAMPNSEDLFELLQQTLVSLSYLHLLHTHRHDLSHLYASLALRMSLRVASLVQRRVQTAAALLQAAAGRDATKHTTLSLGNATAQALGRLSEEATVGWAASTMLEEVQEATTAASQARSGDGDSDAAAATAQESAMRRLTSVADSPFVSTEALLLLGASSWAAADALSGTAVNSSNFARRLHDWDMAPFDLFATLAEDLGGIAPLQDSDRANPDTPGAQASPGGSLRSSPTAAVVVDVHALFVACLAAMKRWKRDFPLVHMIDTTSYSVRRTDPFVLSSFLLRARNPDTGAPLLSLPKLREVAVAATPHFFGDAPQLLPLLDDTVESYAARLLRFAAHHIHALEPTAELLRSGTYGAGRAGLKPVASPFIDVGGRTATALDDAPPRKSRLRTLRRVKQQTLENADLQPLLYAADVHDYLNASRWTVVATALNAVYNAVLFPFTRTALEAQLAGMEQQVQMVERPLAAGRREKAAAAAAAPPMPAHSAKTAAETSVSLFVDLFAKEAALREFFLAGQLLGVSLESGMPEGFSLIVLEAADRGNRHLRPIASQLAESVLGPLAPCVWTEHHLTAQWQREKSRLVGEGPLFALNTRSPFRYASVEGRQELFARLNRWNAAVAVSEGRTAQALDQLLWCAGYLVRRVHRHSRRVYPYAYEGAVYPAADLECVAELNRFLKKHGPAPRSAGSAASPVAAPTRHARRQMEQDGVQLLQDLSRRLGYVYDLVEEAPARRIPFSQADFTRNTSAVEAAVETAERQHTYMSRFARTSTQLVEPWNRLSADYSDKVVAYGDGYYYNQRLHHVSGYRWGAAVHALWLRIRYLWPW